MNALNFFNPLRLSLSLPFTKERFCKTGFYALIVVVFVANIKATYGADIDYFRTKRGETKDNGLVSSETVEERFDISAIRNMVVYDGGRTMPFDSYARHTLLIINGKSTMVDSNGVKRDASDWLARVMFTPNVSLDDDVFKIVFPEALHAIGLSPQKSRRYSFNTLAQRLPQLQQLATFSEKIPAEKRSPIEKEFLRIYDSYVRYYQVLSAFLFALPSETFRISNPEVIERLGLERSFQAEIGVQQNAFSYLDLMSVSERLLSWAEQATNKAEKERNAQDLIVIEIRNRYISFPTTYSSLPLKLLPSFSHDEDRWFSAWQLFTIAKGKNILQSEVLHLKSMVEGYRNRQQETFTDSTVKFKAVVQERIEQADKPYEKKATLETFYNQLDPFYTAMLAYFFALPLLVPVFLRSRVDSVQSLFHRFLFRTRGAAYYVSLVAIGLGVLLSLVGLAMRIYITSRPPITNLYTTFLFVSLVSVLICIGLEWLYRGGFGILSGAISGGMLLLISMRFAAEGDTMNVLIAVLRSNFWLSTHVITINLGYAGIVLSGVIAHVLLFYLLRRPDDGEIHKKLVAMVYSTQAFGLIFTVVGTLLGGVWADQSWGRFWGWDPKENGSLLIILWSAMAFHARFSGLVKKAGFAALAVVGIMVVMVAWFGINLLGVGLHSYGFTAGIAYPLFSYLGLQTIALFLMLYFLEVRKGKKRLKQ